MKDDLLFGRLIIAFIFGPPFGVIYLLGEERTYLGIALLIGYILLSCLAIKYLDQSRIVSKWLSIPIVFSLSVICVILIYVQFA